ncbi:MAG: cytochrome C [Proteobacteria bacterium]|nr:cytochrome C [Pseudomonadota bacterium]MBU1639129.1 cytochrome C [Pseudomonadota bacterium]
MSVAPSLVMSSEVGPETIDMKAEFKVEGAKQAVIFPHRQHQAKLACGKCHQSPQGGDDLIVEFVNKTGSGNDFHKKFCWPCHVEMEVPKGKSCSTCHK